MKRFAYLPNVATLELDREACIGCGMCLEVCPHQVFALREDKAAIVDRDRCMEWRRLPDELPRGGDRVDAGVGCAAGMINEWLGEILPRRRRSGCC